MSPADLPIVVEVVRSQGHLTLRIYFEEIKRADRERILDEIVRRGATYENADDMMYALDLEPNVNPQRLLDYLALEEEAGPSGMGERLVMNVTLSDGVSIFVQELGEGFPLFVLHGGPGLDHSIRLYLDPLADEFRLLYVDERGQGRSERVDPATLSLDVFAHDVDLLAEALGALSASPCSATLSGRSSRRSMRSSSEPRLPTSSRAAATPVPT